MRFRSFYIKTLDALVELDPEECIELLGPKVVMNVDGEVVVNPQGIHLFPILCQCLGYLLIDDEPLIKDDCIAIVLSLMKTPWPCFIPEC